MNHVQGCSHGCKYPCYAYLMAKRFGKAKSYEEWCKPLLVSNTLELLDKEIPRLRSKIKSVQLCFTTDPFMYKYEDVCSMSLAAIRKLNDSDIPCIVLTKGILPLELAQMSKKNTYGITMVSLDEAYREEIEPGAAPYAERIKSLHELSDRGYKTWVSMEPYPTPNIHTQKIEDILESVKFVDRIIFGRTNYNKAVSSYINSKEWYNEQVEKVITFCRSNGIDFYIKKGTWTRKQTLPE